MNGTSVSNGTRLSPISISQRSFGNFPESFGKWKTPYLSGRTQVTTINGCQSQAMPVTFGVPQGSVLGPILFSLFCNELPDITEGIDGDPQLHMYADDTTVYVSAPTFDLVASKLNEVLASLYMVL